MILSMTPWEQTPEKVQINQRTGKSLQRKATGIQDRFVFEIHLLDGCELPTITWYL